MKAMTWIAGILTALSVATTQADDKKTDLSASGQSTNATPAKAEEQPPDKREKLASQVLTEKAPDKIVGKRFVCSGPLVALLKSDHPIKTFNPFSAANSETHSDAARIDSYLRPPRGYVLFRF